LFIVGIIMLVFAGMFHLFRYGRVLAKTPSPKIITAPPKDTRPVISPPPAAPPLTQSREEKPIVTPSSQKSLGTGTHQKQSSTQSTIGEAAVTRGDNSRNSTAPATSGQFFEPMVDENNTRNTLNTKSNAAASDELSRKNPTDNERRKM
jgi:ubiquinol-cytochrome c reductase cytochrome b subunit